MTTWKPIGDDRENTWVGSGVSDRFPVYTRGNAGEVYPAVFTPLSFSIASEAGEQAMRNAILSTGLIRPSELDGIPMSTGCGTGVYGGYAYLNLSIQRLAAARFPGGSANDADVNYLGVGEPPPHEPLPGERNLRASLAGLRFLWRTMNTKDVPELAADGREVDRFLARLPDVDSASDHELRRVVDDLLPLFTKLFERHLVITTAAGIAVSALTQMCERQLGDQMLAVRLLAGLGDVDSAAPSQAIWKLSRLVDAEPLVAAEFDQGMSGLLDRLQAVGGPAGPFLDGFDEFLAAFGSRGPNEWDTAFDSWETDPGLALTLIDRMRAADDSHNPSLQKDRLAKEAAQLETEVLGQVGRPSRGMFRKILAAARMYSRLRERTKTTVIRAIHGVRLTSKELDRRLVERSGGQAGDLWFLLSEELDDYLADPSSMAERIADRREQHRRLDERVPPFFFDGVMPPIDEWELKTSTRPRLENGDRLTGLPGCPGVARGRARVVTDPADPRGLEPGDVLVAPLTDPAWTPLFVPAQAVVVDVGAVMSHAVIVSRELGIPCVVSATDATKRIVDGTEIEVDGTAGTVTVIG